MSSISVPSVDAADDRERRIINALETYFSDASLLWDKVMQQKIMSNPQGMVSLTELVKLPKLRSFQVTDEELLSYIEKHSLTRLQLNEDKTKIGRIRPYVPNKKEVLDEWSIYVEGLTKPYHEEFKIKELFHTLTGGHVSFYSVPPNQQGSTAFYGYCFLEFDDKMYVEKAIHLFSEQKGNDGKAHRKNEDEVMLDENQAKLLRKLDLRVISKLEWNRLRDEYVELLAEKKAGFKKLWDDYNNEQQQEDNGESQHDGDKREARVSQKRGPHGIVDDDVPATKKYKNGSQTDKTTSSKAVKTDEYPKGVIVFVDNLHLQCPKTIALKLLESRADVKIPFMGVKKKGLASVHIRLNTADDAQRICAYFNEQHAIIQENEKDTTGTEMDERTGSCIKMRLLQGTEERIYWENDTK
ncbi:hypothetical protein BDF20DRAFT_832571 [Mycotypha africana]|uniref:uncharacterized protein n=1 Tax=Mycotypha africana TaxID=64632 RepID=UPI002301C44D|nr:uncharacterized protein BDF20DRAFT_832571 [Mycotypha africana]KAI8987663.1 hypothetical protein BDF20DRAFT_832571 [Mycotypha africana]